jgi:hypothetical protein
MRPSRLALVAAPALAAAALTLALATHATAQSGSGTVTGRVLWGSCLRSIPLPMSPDAATPDAQVAPDGRPMPGLVNGLPAGAVLVAVQNTAVSARTDEAGRFTLSGVPAGQYLTIAAGPVANSTSATAARPNVLVSGGQNLDVGTLALGGPSPLGIGCRFPSGAANGVTDAGPGPEAPEAGPGTP